MTFLMLIFSFIYSLQVYLFQQMDAGTVSSHIHTPRRYIGKQTETINTNALPLQPLFHSSINTSKHYLKVYHLCSILVAYVHRNRVLG